MIYHLKANQFAVFFQYSANFKLTFHVEKGLNFSYIGFLKLANFRTRFSKRDHCVIWVLRKQPLKCLNRGDLDPFLDYFDV